VSLAESAEFSKEDVLALLRKTMQSEFGLSADELHPTTHLIDDLDLDSIDFVDIAVSVEESTGLRLSEEELKSVRTIQDAVDAIYAGLAGRGAGGA